VHLLMIEKRRLSRGFGLKNSKNSFPAAFEALVAIVLYYLNRDFE